MQRVRVLGNHLLSPTGCAGDQKLPLAGIKVLDCCQAITGPFSTMQLGDMGADVIKVEGPSGPGDMNRAVGPMTGGEYSVYFHNHNRGKRCIALDMRKPEGLAALKDLAKSADVLVQNMRPGVATKLGYGYEELKKINPDLIYVSISGFGQSGPYRDRPAFDTMLQCMTGFACIQGGEGPPDLINNFVCDKVTSYTSTQAILAALFARSTGKCRGQHIELNMLDSSLAFFMLESMAYSGDCYVGNPKTTGMNKTRRPPQKIRKTKDGHAAMMIWPEAGHWNTTLKAFGITDAEFQDAASPEGLAKVRKGYGRFQEVLDSKFAAMTNEEVEKLFDQHGLPGTTVVDISDIHKHPQVIHMKSLVEHDVGKMGPIREPRPAPLMSETPLRTGGAAPNRGQHSAEVLREVGYSEEKIGEMRAKGVFGKFG